MGTLQERQRLIGRQVKTQFLKHVTVTLDMLIFNH